LAVQIWRHSFLAASAFFEPRQRRTTTTWQYPHSFKKTGAPEPRVFISDQEEALKSATRRLLPSVPQPLCLWHINNNVRLLTRAEHVWRDANGKTPEEKEDIKQKRTKFMARWDQVAYAKAPIAFYDKWQKLLNDYKS
jgi:hypothetical protein